MERKPGAEQTTDWKEWVRHEESSEEDRSSFDFRPFAGGSRGTGPGARDRTYSDDFAPAHDSRGPAADARTAHEALRGNAAARAIGIRHQDDADHDSTAGAGANE